MLAKGQASPDFCMGTDHSHQNTTKHSIITKDNTIITNSGEFLFAESVDMSQSEASDTIPFADEPIMQDLEQQQVQNGDTLREANRQRGSATILDQQVDYSALDSIYFDIRNQKVYLFGGATLNYGDINLQAAYVEIDFNKNEVFAHGMPDSLGQMQGLPVFTEGEQAFQSEEMRYNFQSKRGRTVGVITEEADGFVHGKVVKIQANRIIHTQDGKYTTCDNPEPHFHIAFRRAKIIPDDKIVTSFAYLVIEGVPLPLVVPFGFFPNRKGQASGILFPTFTESVRRGFGLERGGFYWGVNDYIDLALRGDIYSRGSWATSLESAYRVRYRYSGNFQLSYSMHVEGESGLPDYSRRRDFRIVWNHNQDPKARPNSTFRANVNAGSSNFTRLNNVSDQDYLTNTFSSSISYNANWAGGYNFSANLRHSQNTLSRMVDLSLPEIAFGVSRFNPFRRSEQIGELRWYENINMTYNLNARNQISVPDSLLFDKSVISQMRNGINHTLPISHSFRLFRHLNMSNSINLQSRWYFSTISRDWDPNAYNVTLQGDTIYGAVVTDTIPGFRHASDFNLSSSINTRIYGMLQFKRGPVRALRHVLSPSIGFSYRPDFADPFWGYYKEYSVPVPETIDIIDGQPSQIINQYSIFEGGIYGSPQANRSGNISFSLTNNLEMKVRSRREGDEGERKITLIDNLTISSGYDVARDSLNFNDISLSGRTRLFGNFDITFSSRWTVYDRDTLGRPVNRFLWDTKDKPLQLDNTRWAFSLNYTLNSKAKARPTSGTDQMFGPDGDGMPPNGMNGDFDNGQTEPPQDAIDPFESPMNGIDLSVPWNLRLSYQFDYTTRFMPLEERFTRTIIQNLGVTGDVSLTPNWRIGFRSGYDFNMKEIIYTSLNVYRDLHCWEMMIDWIPFGYRKSYSLTIRVKSSVLQDLKLTRRTSHLDRQVDF